VAQQPATVRRIGMLSGGVVSPERTPYVEAFLQSLRDPGWVEGQSLAFAYPSAEGHAEQLPTLAAELVRLQAEVIVTVAGATRATKDATSTIPIVMVTAEEPVAFGLVKRLARPGGNITGLAVVPGAEIYGKNLELLTEVLPKGARIGVLFHATAAVNALWLHATEEAAQGLGVTLVPAGVRSAEDFEQALAVMQHENARGFVVLGGPLRRGRMRCDALS